MKEKWSVGTYIVPLQDRLLSRCETLIAYKPYKIIRNYQIPIIKSENGVEINFCSSGVSVEEREGIRWFETYEEAEEFAKTLIEDKKPQELTVFPSEGCCKFDKQIEDLLRKNHSLYESSKVFEISKVKQPLKQAVHCTTQEQWDFVLSKLPTSCLLSKQSNKFVEYNTDYKHENGIAVDVEARAYCGIGWYKSEGYQILSFQEWCDLNGYKMEKEVEFEVGKWYSFNWDWHSKTNATVIAKIKSIGNTEINISWRSYLWNKNDYNYHDSYTFVDISDIKELSIEEIQQFLPEGHPDKISGTDVTDIESKTPNLLKTFQLPHEWCIKTTAENQKEIADWRTSGYCGIGMYCLNQWHVKSPYRTVVGYAVANIPEGTIEISTEEFRKYVLNKKENPKLNIGDWVYCTHSSGEDLGYETNGNNRDITKGYVGKITGFFDEVWTEDSVSRWVQLDGNNQDGVVECLLRLATPEEIKNSPTENPKSILDFRVGQWVRITKSSSNWAPQMDVFDGKIVQITAIKYGCIQFKGSGLYCWILKDKHFRALTQEESLLIGIDPVKSVYQNLTIKEDDTEIIFLPEPD